MSLSNYNGKSIISIFFTISFKKKLKVKLVVMDLSSLFRSVMTTLFPNAEITADKFHVIRLAVWAMENVRKKVQKQFYKERHKWCKRSKRLLTTPENKLNSDEKLELNRLLRMSKELGTAYALKEYFYKIFQTKTKEAATNQLSN